MSDYNQKKTGNIKQYNINKENDAKTKNLFGNNNIEIKDKKLQYQNIFSFKEQSNDCNSFNNNDNKSFNIKGNSLFEKIDDNKKLFENRNIIQSKDIFKNIKSNNLFGNTRNNENHNNNKEILLGNNDNINNNNFNIFSNNINNSFSFGNQLKIIRNNKSLFNNNIIKCTHENNFISYCLENSNNNGGLLCYDCLYKYHIQHISKCIPIKNNNFDNYKNYYK